jgi:hypothetical protein
VFNVLQMDSKQVTMHAMFLFVLLVHLVQAQVEKKHVSQDPCAPKTTCHECIQTPTCAWCSEPWDMTDRVSKRELSNFILKLYKRHYHLC